MTASSSPLLAKVYAKAIYNRAIVCKNWNTWELFLKVATQIVCHPKLNKVLDKPGVDTAKQVHWLIQLSDPVSFEEGKRLFQLLAKRKRLHLLPMITKYCFSYHLKHENILQVEVISAVALTKAEHEQIQTCLVKKFQKQIVLNEQVQPDCLGGILLRIGDHVIDATVKARLNRLRAFLSFSPG